MPICLVGVSQKSHLNRQILTLERPLGCLRTLGRCGELAQLRVRPPRFFGVKRKTFGLQSPLGGTRSRSVRIFAREYVEPRRGIEPLTCRLQGGCSAV